MESYDVVIVGGGPAGFNSAKTLRELHPQKRILLINDKEDLQIPCSIPYVIGGKLPIEKNRYPLTKVREFADLLIDRVTGIEPDTATLFTPTKRIRYEKLILATGWLPKRLRVPGSDLEGIYYIDTTTQGVERLKREIEEARRITIIGAGFISIGFSDQISRAYKGKEITVIEASSNLASGVFSTEFEEQMVEKLKEQGVKILTGQKVIGFEGEGRVKEVVTQEGKIESSLVLIFIGFTPNSRLALEGGIKTDERGFIEVDSFLRTSADRVLAAGNCITHTSVVDGKRIPAMLASVSARDGRIAALNAFGPKLKDEGVVPAGLTEVRGVIYGFAGYTKKFLEREGFKYKEVSVSTSDAYPGALPGCNPLKVKLYFTESGNLVGGELSGRSRGVWSLVEVTARLIEGRKRAWELLGLLTTAFPPSTPPPLLQPIQEAAAKFLKG